jgi:hypothetical protein
LLQILLILSAVTVIHLLKSAGCLLLACYFDQQYQEPNSLSMNILIIVMSLISAYVLFVSMSYLIARMLFPKIEVDEFQERARELRARQRRLARALR